MNKNIEFYDNSLQQYFRNFPKLVSESVFESTVRKQTSKLNPVCTNYSYKHTP